jgi:hypothetical protein
MVVHAYTPATLKTKVGGLWSETSQGKSVRPYLKNKLKGLGAWLK